MRRKLDREKSGRTPTYEVNVPNTYSGQRERNLAFK